MLLDLLLDGRVHTKLLVALILLILLNLLLEVLVLVHSHINGRVKIVDWVLRLCSLYLLNSIVCLHLGPSKHTRHLITLSHLAIVICLHNIINFNFQGIFPLITITKEPSKQILEGLNICVKYLH